MVRCRFARLGCAEGISTRKLDLLSASGLFQPLTVASLFLRPCLPAISRFAKMFFKRDDELRAFKLLAERGFGPRLLATLGNGRVEQFLEGKVRCSNITSARSCNRELPTARGTVYGAS